MLTNFVSKDEEQNSGEEEDVEEDLSGLFKVLKKKTLGAAEAKKAVNKKDCNTFASNLMDLEEVNALLAIQ